MKDAISKYVLKLLMALIAVGCFSTPCIADSYDPLKRIAGIVDSQDFLMSESFDYNLNGNPTSIVRGGDGNGTMVRTIVDKNGAMMQAMDYYSTGIPHSKLLAQPVDNRMHTGKEFQNLNGLGWYDNSARQMDAILGRFTTPDPLAEKYYSPYAHCTNNLLKYVDPDGRKPRIYVETKGLGHAFVTTGTGKGTTVYTYGRYGDVDKDKCSAQRTSPMGEGVLIKLT